MIENKSKRVSGKPILKHKGELYIAQWDLQRNATWMWALVGSEPDCWKPLQELYMNAKDAIIKQAR